MKVTLVLDGKKEKMRVKGGAPVASLLQKLGINRETVLVRKNGEICVEEEKIREGDEIEVIRAVSGG